MRAPLSRVVIAFLAVTVLLPRSARAGSEPHWIRIDSSHFTLLTDADLGKGREVMVRFEQMRGEFAQLLYKSRVNMPEPIDIIALNSDDEYAKVAPSRPGTGLDKAFFIPGDDRYYFVLNLAHEDSWRLISRDFAQALLNYNYPPTQPWFDTGVSEYFSSLKLTDKQMEIGEDPNQGGSDSYLRILSDSQWLSLPQLFTTSDPTKPSRLYNAESWLLLHYLLNNEKLPAAGTYFGLIENQKLPAEEAIQKAFGVSSAQLEQTLKDYSHALATKLASSAKQAQPGTPAPVAADVVGTSNHEMLPGVARAMVAEMALRLPEHRDEARSQLTSMVDQAQVDNTIVHRALAWDFLQKKDFDHAIEELANGLVFDAKDPMSHYYLALCRYQAAKTNAQEMKGLANMMQDLHLVLDWKHEFADAYYMLGVAQTEGGGLRAAAESIRAAIDLSPRRTDYLLELARIYEDGKSWDAATALLERLSANPNSEIASAAKKQLHDLPYMKKYGIPPADSEEQAKAPTATKPTVAPSPPVVTAKTQTPKPSAQETEDSDAEASTQAPAAPQIDRRPIRFLKGKLLSVDCSQAPAAVVKVAAGSKTMSLRTADYKSLSLVGADTFSCDWSDRPVSVNYKAGGKADGDLVSLELR